MKIAFQVYPGEHWLGGVATFVDLFVALRRLEFEAPRVLLVLWENTPESDYAAFLPFADETARAVYPSVWSPAPARPRPSRRQKLLRRLGQPPPPPPADAQANVLRAHGADCSFTVVLDGRRDRSVPLMTWFYDFQHRNLPELFAPEERQQRDQTLMREAEWATRVLVKSNAIAADFREFAPALASKVAVLPWIADIPASIYDQDPGGMRAQYHLPEKFFYLPNQFWKHKNHEVVFQALARLQARGVCPFLVCTGSLLDSRDPAYSGQVVQMLSRLNLREQVALLGVVPREHVLLLMRQALRVINPSLFEGFGLSVAECKSLGKGLLLADLPVLHEQDAPNSQYFDPHDPAALADCLERVWKTEQPGPDLALEAAARASLPQRQAAFAERFMAIARAAAQPALAPGGARAP